jgi:hypothetical protein
VPAELAGVGQLVQRAAADRRLGASRADEEDVVAGRVLVHPVEHPTPQGRQIDAGLPQFLEQRVAQAVPLPQQAVVVVFDLLEVHKRVGHPPVPVDGGAVEVEDRLSEAAVGEPEAAQALDERARVVRRVGRLGRLRERPLDRQVVGRVTVADSLDLFLDLAAADRRLARGL